MLGILFAIGALVSWGVGDFLIQRTTRRIGDVRTLFWIGLVAFFGLLPFVWKGVPALLAHPGNLAVLVLGSVVMFFGALFDFEALKRGKIAIVEPLLALEVPIAVGLAVAVWGERLTLAQSLLVACIFLGIVLAITAHHTHLHYHKRIFEKGVILAGVGAIGMGLANFLVGVSSEVASPLLAIWVVQGLLFFFCLAYFIEQGKAGHLIADIRRYPLLIIAQSVIDNAAWFFYAAAVTYISISVTTAISESYVVLAALLGVLVNREKLKWHQYVGIAITCASVILLSYVTG